jgi:hypothetical protein
MVCDQDHRQPKFRPQVLEMLEDLRLHHHVEPGTDGPYDSQSLGAVS